MSKKVLIITYYWPPSGGPGVQRVLNFAKYLPKFGWEPIILTVRKGEYPARDISLEKEIPSGLKIYKTKKISCTDIPFVIGKTLLQTADRPGQIPDAGFFQPLVIIKLGKVIHLLLNQYIGSTVRTIIQICICQERSTVYAVHSLLLILHVCCS